MTFLNANRRFGIEKSCASPLLSFHVRMLVNLHGVVRVKTQRQLPNAVTADFEHTRHRNLRLCTTTQAHENAAAIDYLICVHTLNKVHARQA